MKKWKSEKFYLNIIGGYEESYYNLLMAKLTEYDLNSNVAFHGRLEFNNIYEYLRNSNFFIFPSKEKREGQSNSLTEAMGCGVVPIVSDVGFNRSIVNNDDLVIAEFNSKKYARKIKNIWSSGLWPALSEDVYNRVLLNFTESKVSERLLEAYSNIDVRESHFKIDN